MTEIDDSGKIDVVPRRLKFAILKGFALMGWLILTNLRLVAKRLREGHEKYRRPPKSYEIEEYRKGMRFSDSEEKYLRPTLYCNCRAPEIIAMAHKLGAFKKSDYEYAESAFEFVKRNVIFECVEMDDVVETLRRGTGPCTHKVSLFIALLRVAAIKARYKFFSNVYTDVWNERLLYADVLSQKFYDVMGSFVLHIEAEVYIDGKWIVGDVWDTPESMAATGVPINKFGEDSIGVYFNAVSGTIMRAESLSIIAKKPLQYILGFAMNRIVPETIDRINIRMLQQIEEGAKIFEELGEEEYNRRARERYTSPKFKIELERKPGLKFERG